MFFPERELMSLDLNHPLSIGIDIETGGHVFQIILTNTFGGTRYRLALHKLEERVFELNEAAARLGREVADAATSA